ncbi:MAG: FAD-dependent oxidoreductase [Clostridiales Family XIII bacterium]|jgi:adenylylsulfate reductase subunit A|nr:FAD-dependent oxidoreductase [Clostridiales Family XIII bacterium]
MSDFEVRKYVTDILIVGGGIGGLAAAIRARENGADVIVLEKANARRSGLAGSGLDHIQSYIPEFHGKIGYSEEDLSADQFEFGGNPGGLHRKDLTDYFAAHSAADVIELEKYGLKFRFEDSDRPGGFRIVPQFHNVPSSYHFEGRDVKPALAKHALELGVKIFNRQHVRELVTDGGAVTGAVSIGTRDYVITAVSAKTTILATSGVASRLSSGVTNGDTFETFGTPTASAGSGKVLAAKAGAEVVNLEFINLVTGYSFQNYSFTIGFPGGSWWPAGRIVDEDCQVVVPRTRDLPPDDPDYKAKYRELIRHSGEERGKIVPLLLQGKNLYFDLQEATDAEIDYIWWALGHEGKSGVIKHHLASRGVNFKTARFPVRLAGKNAPVLAGLWVKDSSLETNIQNLYVAGNELAGTGMPLPAAGNALVFGFRAGEQAAARAKETDTAADGSGAIIQSLQAQAGEILSRENGDHWFNAEDGLQILIDNNLGKPYTENALALTAQLLQKQRDGLKLSAANLHELSRSFEVLDLYDLAELVIASIRERKSSVGSFVRLDEAKYPAEKYGDSIAVYRKDGKVKARRLSNLV